MTDDAKEVVTRGGIWCFRGQHIIPQGSQYFTAADGATVCDAHRYVEPKEVQLAGSHE